MARPWCSSTMICGSRGRSATTPLLSVAELTTRYRPAQGLFGRTELTAVRRVSFAVAENEFVAIVGESGSGKSTVAKLIIGLERASSGRIALGGVDIANPSEAARRRRADIVQMVFQDPQS